MSGMENSFAGIGSAFLFACFLWDKFKFDILGQNRLHSKILSVDLTPTVLKLTLSLNCI